MQACVAAGAARHPHRCLHAWQTWASPFFPLPRQCGRPPHACLHARPAARRAWCVRRMPLILRRRARAPRLQQMQRCGSASRRLALAPMSKEVHAGVLPPCALRGLPIVLECRSRGCSNAHIDDAACQKGMMQLGQHLNLGWGCCLCRHTLQPTRGRVLYCNPSPPLCGPLILSPMPIPACRTTRAPTGTPPRRCWPSRPCPRPPLSVCRRS